MGMASHNDHLGIHLAKWQNKLVQGNNFTKLPPFSTIKVSALALSLALTTFTGF